MLLFVNILLHQVRIFDDNYFLTIPKSGCKLNTNKEAGLNLAMAGWYVWSDDAVFAKDKSTFNPQAGTIESLKGHLDLLEKHKVAALIDVYYLNYPTTGQWWNPAHKDEPSLYDRYGSEANLVIFFIANG